MHSPSCRCPPTGSRSAHWRFLCRDARPYDTTTLNYHWQIWNTQAFSLYTDSTDRIEPASAMLVIEAVLRFMGKNGILDYSCHGGYASSLIEGSSMVNVKSNAAGFFIRKTEVNALSYPRWL